MLHWKPGYSLCRLEGDTAAFLNACAGLDIPVERMAAGDGGGLCYIPVSRLPAAEEAARRKGAVLTPIKRDRATALLRRYRKRAGLVIWPVFTVGVLLFSQCFAWKIEVTGLESLSPELIKSVAAEAGLTIGRFLPTLDTGEVAARIREEIPGVAICAVNKVGARVEINIHEMHNPPVVLPTDPCDVVAAETGKILYMEVYDGQERVKVGETVGKGQQIVTGVTESADGKLRYVHADASVIADAYFSHTFTLRLSQTERVYSGDEEKRYALELFGRRIPLYLPEGAENALSEAGRWLRQASAFLFKGPGDSLALPEETPLLWEETASAAPLTLFGLRLPVVAVTITREGYTEEEKLFTETEAVQTLREAARDWEEENLSDAVIKEREETFRVEERDGGRVGVLEIQYLAEMDIAQPRKLEVVPPADDQSGTG